MKEIAIYGKGGIGKSTLTANLAVALSRGNARVLQIGCDPKHDSTRLLMGGQRITTVLDYIRRTGAADYRLSDILFEGTGGIGCIEAGGPEPGVGCAGRGIITAFELLDQFQVKERFDLVLYDVLGDVVCGGFAVPIRRQYADTIFLVTSGEFMALYAANNILRGIKNYDGDRCRVAGILFNSRKVPGEEARVAAFAKAVGLPVFARIPRDDAFALAERRNCTVMELEEAEAQDVRTLFTETARRILAGPSTYAARPLSDEALEDLIMGGAVQKPSLGARPMPAAPTADAHPPRPAAEAPAAGLLSKNLLRDEPLHGCAFNGAMTMGIHLRDAVLVAHSPRSCTWIASQSITSAGRRALFERGTILPEALSPNIISTEMDESDMVFGGMDKLADTVETLLAQDPPPRAIVIVSSCPAGIIGDDIDQVRAMATTRTPVITIKADGNLAGDYLQGMLLAYTQLARQLINPHAPLRPDTVNIVFEKVVATNTARNYDVMSGFLKALGLSVNCRFLCDTTIDALRDFCSAPLNLLAYQDYTGQLLRDFFSREYGCKFYDRPFPVGFAETAQWLQEVGAFFGRADRAESLIDTARADYRRRIAAVAPALAGKRLMVFTYNHSLDWILQTALDAGIVVVKLCIFNFSQDEGFRSDLPQIDRIPREEDYDKGKRLADIARYKPDIILSNYESEVTGGKAVTDTIPMCPDVGFDAGLRLVERWVSLLQRTQEGGWQNDRVLFNKYYTR